MRYKKVVMILSFLSVAFTAFSQSRNELIGMIDRSLLNYIEVEKSIKKEIEDGLVREDDYSRRMPTTFVVTQGMPVDMEFSQEVIDYGFEFVSFGYVHAHADIFEKEQNAIVFYPLYIEGETITIRFNLWFFRIQDDVLYIEAGYLWVDTTWEYSDETGGWEMAGYKLGGI